jgi:hypothetical protein
MIEFVHLPRHWTPPAWIIFQLVFAAIAVAAMIISIVLFYKTGRKLYELKALRDEHLKIENRDVAPKALSES